MQLLQLIVSLLALSECVHAICEADCQDAQTCKTLGFPAECIEKQAKPCDLYRHYKSVENKFGQKSKHLDGLRWVYLDQTSECFNRLAQRGAYTGIKQEYMYAILDNSTGKTWDEARAACRAVGGRLPVFMLEDRPPNLIEQGVALYYFYLLVDSMVEGALLPFYGYAREADHGEDWTACLPIGLVLDERKGEKRHNANYMKNRGNWIWTNGKPVTNIRPELKTPNVRPYWFSDHNNHGYNNEPNDKPDGTDMVYGYLAPPHGFSSRTDGGYFNDINDRRKSKKQTIARPDMIGNGFMCRKPKDICVACHPGNVICQRYIRTNRRLEEDAWVPIPPTESPLGPDPPGHKPSSSLGTVVESKGSNKLRDLLIIAFVFLVVALNIVVFFIINKRKKRKKAKGEKKMGSSVSAKNNDSAFTTDTDMSTSNTSTEGGTSTM